MGESLEMELRGCELRSGFGGWLYRKDSTCWVRDRVEHNDWPIRGNWFTDNGSIDEPSKIRIRYTAPPTKPNPNPVTVSLTSDPAGEEYNMPSHRVMWTSQITIIDRGYRASEQVAGFVYSGVICSLDKPFTVNATGWRTDALGFIPSSATAGTWSFNTKWNIATFEGSGSYTIEGADTDKPGILVQGSGSGTMPAGRAQSPSGTGHIDLVPLETDECH